MLLAPSSFIFRRLSPYAKKYEFNHKLNIKSGIIAGL